MQPTSSQTLAKMRAGSASRATSMRDAPQRRLLAHERVESRRASRRCPSSRSQEGQHRQDAAVRVAVCGRCPSVSKIDVTCFSTALSVITSCSAMPLLERPWAISSSTSRSRGESSSSGSIPAAAAEHLPHDLGVEHRAALADPAHGVRERVEVADAILEQVADALGAIADQVDGVALLDVLREHEDLGARAARRGSPSPRAGRRRCWSAASGCRRPRRRAGARRPCGAGRPHRPPGRRRRSPPPPAAGSAPCGTAAGPRR